MTLQNFKRLIEHLRNELSKGKIQSVLNELKSNLFKQGEKYNTYIELSGRLQRLNNDNIGGTVRYDNYSLGRNKLFRDVLNFINSLKPEDFIDTSLTITIEDLQDKLRAILKANGIEPINNLLKKILKTNDLRKDINEIEEEYSESVWRLRNDKHDLIEWTTISECLEKKVGDVVDKLDIKYLEDDWETIFSGIDLGTIPNKVNMLFVLFSEVDDIKFPEKIKKEMAVITSVRKNDDGKIIEETTTELVSEEERRRFKRLMFLYQDAYEAGDYELAYRYCTQVREEIEPESGHLYQALLLSYFKLLNREFDIIEKVINGKKEQEFRNLLVYANRLSSITQKSLPKEENLKTTAKYNIREIISGLMVNLKDAYSNVGYDYITAPFEENKDTKKQKRDRVKRCINIAKDITKLEEAGFIFAEIMVNELAGGGKFKWLKINDKKEVVSWHDDTKFNPYIVLKNTQKLIELHKKVEDGAVEKILVRNLRKSLDEKYRKLSKKSKKKNQKYISKRLAECIETYKICTILFEKNKKSFCDIPIRELSSDAGILDWFELDYNAQLKVRFDLASADNFNPLEMLKSFVDIRDGEAVWEGHLQALKERVYEKLKRKTQSIYNTIKTLDEPIKSRHIKIAKSVAECVENWKKCYDLKKEPKFLETAIKELIGEEKLQWFVIGELGLIPHPIFEKIRYNPSKRLEKFTQLINKNTLCENHYITGKNLFDKLIKTRYNHLKSNLSNRPGQIEEFREEIYKLMLATSYLYRLQPLNIYRDTFFEEFVCENIASWFIHKGQKISANDKSKIYDPVRELNLMIKAIEKQDDADFFDEILKWVIDNRYKDTVKEYEDFKVKNGNYSPESRRCVYKLLNQFKASYKPNRNPKYLEILHQEYASDKRGVRWSWRSFFLCTRLGEWMDGMPIRLSYKEELKFVKDNYKSDLKISDKHKLKRPWLKKKPLQLAAGKNVNDNFFGMILNDLFKQKV